MKSQARGCRTAVNRGRQEDHSPHRPPSPTISRTPSTYFSPGGDGAVDCIGIHLGVQAPMLATCKDRTTELRKQRPRAVGLGKGDGGRIERGSIQSARGRKAVPTTFLSDSRIPRTHSQHIFNMLQTTFKLPSNYPQTVLIYPQSTSRTPQYTLNTFPIYCQYTPVHPQECS